MSQSYSSDIQKEERMAIMESDKEQNSNLFWTIDQPTSTQPTGKLLLIQMKQFDFWRKDGLFHNDGTTPKDLMEELWYAQHNRECILPQLYPIDVE